MNPAAILNILVKAEGASRAASELLAVDAAGKKAGDTFSRVDRSSSGAGSRLAAMGANAQAAAGNMSRMGDSTSRANRAFGDADKGARGASGSLKRLGGDADRVSVSLGGLQGGLFNTNAGFTSMRNVAGLIKMPALITGFELAAEGANALAAGAVAAASALAPLVGLAGAGAVALTTFGQGMATLKLATSGVSGALKEQLGNQGKLTSAAGAAASSAKAVAAAQEGVRAAHERVHDAAVRVADSLRAQQEATLTLRDAQKSAREAQAGLSEAYTEARRRLADMHAASRDATLGEKNAIINLSDARKKLQEVIASSDPAHIAVLERDVATAVRGQEDAVDGVTRARDELARVLRGTPPEDLAKAEDAVGDSIRGHERALIGLTRAQENLQKVSADPSASATDRRQAALDLADAQDTLADSNRDVAQSQKDLQAARKGPTDAEIAKARRDVAAAEGGVAEATQKVAQAQSALTQARRGGDKLEIAKATLAVKQAENDLASATRDRGRAESDATAADKAGVAGSQEVVAARKAIADANQRVLDAERGIAASQRATAEASRNLANAQRGVTTALAAVSEAQKTTAGSAANLNEKLQALPPAAQAFVKQLIALKPKLDDLRAVAAQGLFPGVVDGIHAAMANFGPLRAVVGETATVFGGLARRAGELVGSKGFGKDLTTVGARNAQIIQTLGDAALHLANAFRHVVVAAGPLATWIANTAGKWAQYIDVQAKAGRESGKLAAFFESTRVVLSRVGRIVSDLAVGLFNIGKIGKKELGDTLLKDLVGVAEKFKDWTSSAKGENAIAQYFKDAKAPLYEIFGLVGDLGKAFFSLGKSDLLTPLLGQIRSDLLPALTALVKTTAGAFGPAFIEALVQFVKLFTQLAGTSGPLTIFVSMLGKFFGVISSVLEKNDALHSMVVSWIGFAAVLKGMKMLAAVTGLSSLAGAAVASASAYRALAAGATASTVAQERGVAVTYAVRAAMLLATAASVAYAIATRAVGAAFVFMTGPIGLIIIAVAALAAGFVYAYTHSEAFRKVIDAIGAALATAGKAVVDFFVHFDQIPGKMAAAGAAIVHGLIGGIKALPALLATAAKWIGDQLVVGVRAYISSYIAIGGWVVGRIIQGIKATVAGLLTIGSWLRTQIMTSLTAVAEGFKALGGWVVNRITEGIKRTVFALFTLGAWLRGVLTTAFNAVAEGFRALGGWVVNRVVEGVRRTTAGLLGVGGWVRDQLSNGLNSVKEGIFGLGGKIIGWIVDGLKAGANKLVDFLNDIVKVINLLPGVEIKPIKGFAEGGQHGAGSPGGGGAQAAFARGGAFARTGGVVSSPITLMGEEAPRHPEFVIPTNPAYRKRAKGLLGQAAGAIGLAEGGVVSAFKSAIGRTNATAKPSLALFEAGIVESGLTNLKLGQGDRDSIGALQIRASTAAPMGINPGDPFASAMAFLTRGFWNKGSAIALAAGNPNATAGWVAQNTQGSAFPDRYDQVRGQAQSFLGGGAGGILGKVGGAIGGAVGAVGGIVGDLLGKGASFLLDKLPGTGDLPDWLKGTGDYILNQVGSFIKDNVQDIVGNLLGGGGSGGGAETTPKGDKGDIVKRMLSFAASKDGPYTWGGGHAPGTFGGPYDCSGFVSAILRAGGMMTGSMTTDGLKGFGMPGPGESITVGVRGSTGRNAHTMIKIAGRYFESGSGHGAKEVGGWSGGFPIQRHPGGFAKGGLYDKSALFDPANKDFLGFGMRAGGRYGPYIGSYRNGGIAPQTGMAHVHKGEAIVPMRTGGVISRWNSLGTLGLISQASRAAPTPPVDTTPYSQSDIDNLQNEIGSLKSEVADLNAQIVSLNAQIDALNFTIARLTELVALQNTRIAELQKNYNVSQSQYGTLAKAIADVASGEIGGRVGLGFMSPGFSGGGARY